MKWDNAIDFSKDCFNGRAAADREVRLQKYGSKEWNAASSSIALRQSNDLLQCL